MWILPIVHFEQIDRLMDGQPYKSTNDASQVLFLTTTRRLGWGLECEYFQKFISNRIVPNRFVDVYGLNSRRCCLIKVLCSFDVRWFSNTVSGVNVTWRRIRARSDQESLKSSESDVESLISSEFLITSESEFLLVAVVSPSDANDEGLESLVVSRPS